MWKCSVCNRIYPDKRIKDFMKCPNCGLVLATEGTRQKHQFLRSVYSLNKYELVIDACAGSGVLQLPDGKLTKGSPLILEELVKGKGKCICIDVNKDTCSLLRKQIKGSVVLKGDCNKILPTLVKGKKRTLIYIDPFGYGVPVIDRAMVLGLAQTPNTDLLIHFSWRICREMGHARTYLNCDIADCPSPTGVSSMVTSCDNCANRKRAKSYVRSLGIWWGTPDWIEWDFKGDRRAERYVEIYARPFRKNNEIQIVPVNHSFHLIFATKFSKPQMSLERFFGD